MGVMRWLSVSALGALLMSPLAMGREPGDARPVAEWSREAWRAAAAGSQSDLRALLNADISPADSPEARSLRDAARRLDGHIADREARRAEREKELRADFEKAAAETDDASLRKALKAVTELWMIVPNRDALLAEPAVASLVDRSARAARQAEEHGESLAASELIVLLNALHEESGTYKKDLERLNQRLTMLRLYMPERLWQMRDERQRALGEKPLPPYNPLGDDWHAKLATITQVMVEHAMRYAEQHVERIPRVELLRGGLESVRTMVTTGDLRAVFPGLGDQRSRDAMLVFLDEEAARLAGDRDTPVRTGQLLDRLRAANERTVRIDSEALLHEFGNGAMQRLDEFSQIIWPDEVRRFQRTTQGRFVGVGIQLEYDAMMSVRVVTPLAGTPAHRAGVMPGDVIIKVDGKSIFGLSLDQAIELITGPAGTRVVLTVERADAERPENAKKEVDIPINRGVIDVYTARGWKRTGQGEDDWNWFIDDDSRIGYIRLSQFTEKTADELTRAANVLRQGGVRGLILDLRFNPGGLLDQAVKVSRRFIAVPNGKIVGMSGQGNLVDPPEMTRPAQAILADIPLVVLINEGSASASEIVSGALRCYADQGALDALVIGQRSYGKGSVQNVWQLTGNSMMKVTIQYYTLPNDRIIHRRPGAADWGVTPHLAVDMLPKQTEESILLRRDADVIPSDPGAGTAAPRANPDDLLSKGTDLQLETAVLLLKARAAAGPEQAAKK